MNSHGLYRRVASMSARAELSEPRIILGQLLFLAVLTYIFSNLWREMYSSGYSSFEAPSDYLWYLLSTELVILSTPQVFRAIQDDVRSGDVAQRLLKPVPYWAFHLAEGMGVCFARLLVLMPVGSLVCLFVTGGFPPVLYGILITFLLVPISCFVLLLFFISIGLLSLWLYDSVPFYWVFQKLIFVFGGLMLPLTIYPEWMQTVAAATPCRALLYGVARNTLEVNRNTILEGFGGLIFWGLVAWIGMLSIYSRVTRRLVQGGG